MISVSIIIPCFNAEKFIAQCLESILHSDFQDFEIIVVDDGSTDQTVEYLKTQNLKLKLIENKKNVGPAKARNLGTKNAFGKYLFFLDVDTKIDKYCLNAIVKKFESNPAIGAIQGKLLPTETAGHFLTFFGFPYEIGVSEPAENHNQETRIFGARSAAMAIQKELFEKIGGFDENYFIYGEDTDLSWRVWLADYEVHFLPQAKVYHLGKSSLSKETNYRVFYEGAKNNTQNILKNAPLDMILWMLPLHILGWLAVSLKLILQRRFRSALWVYQGLLSNLRNLKNLRTKRKQIAKYKNPNPKLSKIMFGPLGSKKIFRKGLKWIKNV